jgi:MFS family permease
VRGIDRRPLGVAAFRRLWAASGLAALTGSATAVAIPAQLFERSGSSAAVAAAAAASFAALTVAALTGGALADRHDRRRVLLGVDLAAMVLGLPVALLPELARRFGDPAGGGVALGLLTAAYPTGVVAAGLLSGSFTRVRRQGVGLAVAACVWGVTLLGLGTAPRVELAALALAAGGAANLPLSTFRTAITQATTDDAVRGRVQGALTVVLLGGPQAAGVVHGLAGAALGARTAICLGGLLTVAAVAAIALASAPLRGYAVGGAEGPDPRILDT